MVMSNTYGSQNVQCPFYQSEVKNSIKCEGTISYGCIHCFKSTKQKQRLKEKFCETNYKSCPHYIILMKKYN